MCGRRLTRVVAIPAACRHRWHTPPLPGGWSRSGQPAARNEMGGGKQHEPAKSSLEVGLERRTMHEYSHNREAALAGLIRRRSSQPYLE